MHYVEKKGAEVDGGRYRCWYCGEDTDILFDGMCFSCKRKAEEDYSDREREKEQRRGDEKEGGKQ